MSLRTLLGIVALTILLVAVVTGWAGKDKYKVKVEKGLRHENISILAALGDAKTSVLIIDACGTILTFTIPTAEVTETNVELQKFVEDQISKACK